MADWYYFNTNIPIVKNSLTEMNLKFISIET